jgi:hypothetical protein
VNEFQFSDLKKLSQLFSETVNPGVVYRANRAMKSIGKTRAILGTTIIRNVIRTVVKTFWEKCDNDGRKKKD